MKVLRQLEKQLVVSCQALEDEPLHSSFVMGKMAIAASQGGSAGIRANTVTDIKEIKKQVNLPIVGIIKQDYEDSDIYITPTLQEVKELLNTDIDVIAIDATSRNRPNNERLDTIVDYVKRQAPDVALMADISTIEEAFTAVELGFNCVSTTLIGYTAETKGKSLADNDFSFLKQLVEKISIPVVAEGKIDTPSKAARALAYGAHFVVVGSAITRPQIITKTFTDTIKDVD